MLLMFDYASAKLVVEVDQVFCFSLLHYQVIYMWEFLQFVEF